MKAAFARLCAVLVLSTGSLGACQLVSGINDLEIVDGGAAPPDAGADTAYVDTGSDTGRPSDASPSNDAGPPDASDAGPAPDAGCTAGWQCPAGSCSNGACVEPPSCHGLPTNCGPSSNEDCCTSKAVPVGGGITYNRGNDPGSPATITQPFALDRFEVTVARFEKFVAAYNGQVPPNAGAYPPVSGTGWNTSWTIPATASDLQTAVTSCPQPFLSTSSPQPTPNAPMNCVDWYIAFAFCAWDGSRLPTEAEWNLAAADGTAERTYPWSSSTISTTNAWYCPNGGPADGGPPPCAGTQPKNVGSESSAGDGAFGHADLAGSVWEPMLDFAGAYPSPCMNCVNTTSSSQREYRGGSFLDPAGALVVSNRNNPQPPDFSGQQQPPNLGIRCAR